MTYSSATFYVDIENGSDSARTALTSVAVANNGSGAVRCTKTAHGLVTGAVVDNTTNYTGAWIVTRIDANNFDLVGSTFSTSTALTATPRGGSSKADAWKTYTTGASAARIAAGDTIRVMASLDPTSIGNATWTQYSKTVTLAGALTANISDCESAWTATTNVTVTADTTAFKENTKSMKAVIAGAFTTGKVAYFATGTLDLSGYQQVSLWFLNSITTSTGALSLRLCSDTTGDVTVNTIALPARPDTASWGAFTVDLAGNLGSAIASVALYADTDPGALTVQLDNIIACKASASADSLTLTSLIGKVWNLPWAASTTYAASSIRRPTQTSRNGFCYQVTAGGGGASGSSEPTWPIGIGATVTDGALTWTCLDIEETWLPIQSINGTTVKLDNGVSTLGNAGRGYHGSTETVASYKREPLPFPMMSNNNTGSTGYFLTRSGTSSSVLITYTGGWNRTDMTTKTGETWTSGQSGWGGVLYLNSFNNCLIDNLSGTRFNNGFTTPAASGTMTFQNCHVVGWTNTGFALNISNLYVTMQNIVMANGVASGFSVGSNGTQALFATAIGAYSCLTFSGGLLDLPGAAYAELNHVAMKNNACIFGIGTTLGTVRGTVRNLVSANNTAVITDAFARLSLTNCAMAEASPVAAVTQQWGYLYSHKHGGVADSHLIYAEGGTIIAATDQRHTASGISWKFRPTSTVRDRYYPMRLSVAKFACTANVAVTASIWTRRDSTNIVGLLRVAGGQINGVPSDVTVTCAPTINTWTQSSTLSFTPTEAGVVELTFDVYDGVGTSNNYWIDDLAVS
jgi:hypothetical protein